MKTFREAAEAMLDGLPGILHKSVVLASTFSAALFQGCGKKDPGPPRIMCYAPVAEVSVPDDASVDLLDLKLGVLENNVKDDNLDRDAARKALPTIASEIEKLRKVSSGAEAEKIDALAKRAKKLAAELE